MAMMISPTDERSFRIPKYLRTHFFFSLLMSCFLTFVTTVAYFHVQPRVPIFYSLAEPTDYLSDKVWLFLFPTFSFTITILHLLVIPTLRSYHKVMNLLFGWLTTIVQLLCAVAALRIIMIIW